MNGKQAKRLRRKAELAMVGQQKVSYSLVKGRPTLLGDCARWFYQELKYGFKHPYV